MYILQKKSKFNKEYKEWKDISEFDDFKKASWEMIDKFFDVKDKKEANSYRIIKDDKVVSRMSR